MADAFGGNKLVAHPDTPARAVSTVVYTFIRAADGWAVYFIVGAPPSALKLPAPVDPARANELWKRTCFEMFVLDAATGAYSEFNFSPSGEWAAYRFDGYRAGMRELDVPAPHVVTHDPAQMQLAMRARFRGFGMDEESIARMTAVSPLDKLRAVMPGLAQLPEPQNATLRAEVPDTGMPRDAALRVGLSAVIEEADGTKSYWALSHPPGKPDFHHADCFALELPAPKPARTRKEPKK